MSTMDRENEPVGKFWGGGPIHGEEALFRGQQKGQPSSKKAMAMAYVLLCAAPVETELWTRWGGGQWVAPWHTHGKQSFWHCAVFSRTRMNGNTRRGSDGGQQRQPVEKLVRTRNGGSKRQPMVPWLAFCIFDGCPCEGGQQQQRRGQVDGRRKLNWHAAANR